jgi:hypothetical protein
MSSATRVRLRPLSLVVEGDDVLVGDPETGTFITVPPIGGVIIAAFQRGATLEEVTAEAEVAAGEPVDVADFVAALTALGFVDDGTETPRVAPATAPIQGRRWLAGVNPRLVRPLFGRVAWTCYCLLALFCVGVLVTVPALLPDPSRDAFLLGDIGLSAVLLVPLIMAAAALHEGGHWLAARAIGLSTRFGVDRRMMLLVFETDLTQLWSVPRRSRYGPLLGGMAVDVVLLAFLLTLRLSIHTGTWAAGAAVDAVLATGVYLTVAGLLWQCMVSLRTDLYAVLSNLLGCHDLWRVKTLRLRQAFGRLTTEQAAQLAGASDADRRAAGWFRWVWLVGCVAVLGWFAAFVLPVIVTVVDWTAEKVSARPTDGDFWYGLFCATAFLGPYLLAAAIAVAEYTRRVSHSRTP